MASVHTIYRGCVWLPILVPAVVVFAFNAVGLRPSTGVLAEVLLYSLVYGGLPYAVLALWATWWIGGQPEPAIRRLMFRAPLLMVGVFVLVALVLGLVVGRIGPFVAVAMLGSALIFPLGYAYVGLAVLLRKCFGSQPD